MSNDAPFHEKAEAPPRAQHKDKRDQTIPLQGGVATMAPQGPDTIDKFASRQPCCAATIQEQPLVPAQSPGCPREAVVGAIEYTPPEHLIMVRGSHHYGEL